MVLIHTDLPLPVEPATSPWGHDEISLVIILPSISFPKETFNGLPSFTKSLVIISPNHTVSRLSLGTSIPIVLLPGIGAWIRIAVTPKLAWNVSCRLATFLTLIPFWSSISYLVNVGPLVKLTTSPEISNDSSVSSVSYTHLTLPTNSRV